MCGRRRGTLLHPRATSSHDVPMGTGRRGPRGHFGAAHSTARGSRSQLQQDLGLPTQKRAEEIRNAEVTENNPKAARGSKSTGEEAADPEVSSSLQLELLPPGLSHRTALPTENIGSSPALPGKAQEWGEEIALGLSTKARVLLNSFCCTSSLPSLMTFLQFI